VTRFTVCANNKPALNINRISDRAAKFRIHLLCQRPLESNDGLVEVFAARETGYLFFAFESQVTLLDLDVFPSSQDYARASSRLLDLVRCFCTGRIETGREKEPEKVTRAWRLRLLKSSMQNLKWE